jgi:isopentenyldiphosphate isomerase
MGDPKDEYFEIVDENDRVVGLAPRSECHGNPTLIHRTAHVIVLHRDGRILLQKRSEQKDIQPGKWDTAVGGHLDPKEDYEKAARREMFEELGVDPETPLDFLFNSKIRNDIESENTRVFRAVIEGPFKFDRDEIDELRFWTKKEITENMGKEIFTPNLEEEIKKLIFKNIF